MNERMEALFCQWYKSQCEYENKDSTCFICDGSLSDENLNEHEILFVCRESNDSNGGMKKYFWFKDIVDKKISGGGKYYNCVSMVAKYINKDTDLKKCAYMNINKMGGSKGCDFNRLNKYAERYRDYISKEIEILNPKCIVILGKLAGLGAKSAEDIFVIYGKIHNIDVYIYDRHPCAYRKDIASHIFLKITN